MSEQFRTHRSRAVVEAAKLHRHKHRRERGRTLLEGPNVVGEAISAGAEIDEIFVTSGDGLGVELASRAGLEPILVDERAMGRLAGTETPRGPVAVVVIPEMRARSGRHRLVAHGVSDPGNLGTMVRTAAAFGWDFSYSPGSADPWAPKVVRSGAGGHFRTTISVTASWEDLGGLTTVAAVVSGGEDPATIDGGPFALLIGDEAHGLPVDLGERCEHRVAIPMPGGVESLNASVAAGILVFVLTGGQGRRPGPG